VSLSVSDSAVELTVDVGGAGGTAVDAEMDTIHLLHEHKPITAYEHILYIFKYMSKILLEKKKKKKKIPHRQPSPLLIPL